MSACCRSCSYEMISSLPELRKLRTVAAAVLAVMPPWTTVGRMRNWPSHLSHSSAQFVHNEEGQTTTAFRHKGRRAGRLSTAQIKHKACKVLPKPILSARMQPAPLRMCRCMNRMPSAWCGRKCLLRAGSKKRPKSMSPANMSDPGRGGGSLVAGSTSSFASLVPSASGAKRFRFGWGSAADNVAETAVSCAEFRNARPEVKSSIVISDSISMILLSLMINWRPIGNLSLTRMVRPSLMGFPSSS
mmetsp:Transcript_133842/g.427903  ORF Transcript_133842/g.427903 Transcript_133842/m.427903 type:complete len:245 (+) Transcript_133842:257-991(+)